MGFIIFILILIGIGYLVSAAMGQENKEARNERAEEQYNKAKQQKLAEDSAVEQRRLVKEEQYNKAKQQKLAEDSAVEQRRLVKEEERQKGTTPKITLNPIKWAKYTSIITSAEKKFVDIYNFQTPQEYKDLNYVTNLANTLLFEEARTNRLFPDDFEELLAGFGGDDIFHKIIKPTDNAFFQFKAYNQMYSNYVDFRAREIRPIISMMAVIESMDGTITKEEIKEMSQEYEANPMFGRSV